MGSDAPARVNILLLPVRPSAHREGALTDCGCCGARFPVKRTAMRIIADRSDLGPICPECILLGPKGSAARLRSRKVEGSGGRPLPPARGVPADIRSWNDLLECKAAAIETLEAFPLAARQAALRETRERR